MIVVHRFVAVLLSWVLVVCLAPNDLIAVAAPPLSKRSTVGEGATAVGSYVKYDSVGRAVASQRPSVAGVADWGARTVFYTAGANPDDPACGNRPEWAGQACLTGPAGTITGTDPARMGVTLPTKRVESYSRYGTPLVVSETSTGTGAVKRSTMTMVDAAERTLSTKITVEGGDTTANAAAAVGVVTTVYDPVSGHAVESKTPQGSVKRTLDALGRTLSYTDVSGASAVSTYGRYGEPKTWTVPGLVGGGAYFAGS